MKMMKKQPSLYRAYLLRCWRESNADNDSHTWRFSLEGVQDSQRYGFANLAALLTFLQQTTQAPGEQHELDVLPLKEE